MKDISNLSLIDGKSFNQIYELNQEQVEDHVNNIVRVLKEITTNCLDKLVIVTGCNGSGKSMVRKQMGLVLQERKLKASSASMEKRTTQNPEWGALSGALNDTAWSATSDCSLRLINSLLKQCMGNYLIIDEPEIGMSTAMTQAMAEKLAKVAEDYKHGMMVISHNKHMLLRLSQVTDCVFVNLNGVTFDEYYANFDKPQAFDLEAFDKFNLLFKEIQSRQKED